MYLYTYRLGMPDHKPTLISMVCRCLETNKSHCALIELWLCFFVCSYLKYICSLWESTDCHNILEGGIENGLPDCINYLHCSLLKCIDTDANKKRDPPFWCHQLQGSLLLCSLMQYTSTHNYSRDIKASALLMPLVSTWNYGGFPLET